MDELKIVDEKQKQKVLRAIDKLDKVGFGIKGVEELDPVAYVRFASVYRNFREEKDFVQFVDKLDVYKKR